MSDFVQQMLHLHPKSYLQIVIPGVKIAKFEVATAEKVFPWREYDINPATHQGTWRRSGDLWPALLGVTVGDKDWAPSDVLIIDIGGEQFIFNRREAMGPEGFKPWAALAGQFVSVKPHQATLNHQGKSYEVKLIDRWDIEVVNTTNVAGHIPIGNVARWLLAVSAEGLAVLAEDFITGSTYDSVWSGYKVNLDEVVTDVLS